MGLEGTGSACDLGAAGMKDLSQGQNSHMVTGNLPDMGPDPFPADYTLDELASI